MHAILVSILVPIVFISSCVAKRPSRLSNARKVELIDFTGTYIGKMDKQVTELQIDDLVPEQVRMQLLGNPADAERSLPAASVTIVKEIDSPEIALSRSRYYLLGINKGPIDHVMIELDEEHHAFERTTTTFEDGRLEQRREILYLKKGASLDDSQNAGFDVSLSFSWSGPNLLLQQKVNQLREPWTEHYSANNKVRDSEAVFKKVDAGRKKAEYQRPDDEANL